jgi:ureidoacrylate peracid hydrolase
MLKPLTLEYLLGTRTALIVVDVQKEFCDPSGAFAKKGMDLSVPLGMLETLTPFIAASRAQGLPVIFIQNVEDENTDQYAWLMRPDGREDTVNEGVCRRGTPGTELYIETEKDDIIVEKHRFNAFLNTGLEAVLRELGVETLIFTGLATNVCVETSVRHAVMIGYHTITVSDACASWYPELHEASLTNIKTFFGTVACAGEIMDLWAR